MTEEEAMEYALLAKDEIADRIHKLDEFESKGVLYYVLAKWAEEVTPPYSSPKESIDAEKDNVIRMLDEAIQHMC